MIDKNTGAVVVETTVPSAFLFHHVNAFEGVGTLVVDVLDCPDARAVERRDLDLMRCTAPTAVSKLRPNSGNHLWT